MFKTANEDVRKSIEASGFPKWLIGSQLGWNDSQFSRKLRFELPDEIKKKILAIIDVLKKEEGR